MGDERSLDHSPTELEQRMARTPLQKQARKENELFRAIGEFIFWFSQLEFTIKGRLAGALKLHDDRLFEIVNGPYDFAMLCTVTRETLSLGADNTTERIRDYFSECHKLNHEARVIIAHGSWTLDGALHISRNSLKATFHFGKPGQIKKYTTDAKRLMRELFTLGAIHR